MAPPYRGHLTAYAGIASMMTVRVSGSAGNTPVCSDKRRIIRAIFLSALPALHARLAVLTSTANESKARNNDAMVYRCC